MNYYEILQVSSDASDEVIKAAYKTLVKKYHPDNGAVNNEDMITFLNNAYEVLSNPSSRKKYNESLKSYAEETSDNRAYQQKNAFSDEDLNSYRTEAEGKNGFGKVVQAFFRGVSRELQKNQQIVENAYYEGLQMDDYELIYVFKKNFGLKRQGYTKALEERDFLVRDYEGNLKPTEKFRRYWR